MFKFDKYLVLDCGGGTVDVCVHQIFQAGKDFSVGECHIATGGAWGGIYVNQQFEKFLGDIFSIEFIEKVKNEKFSAWLDIMRDFEYWKRQVDPVETEVDDDGFNIDDDLSTDFSPITIPYPFMRECEKYHSKSFELVIRESRIKSVHMDMDASRLHVTGKQMRKFLFSQINKIVEHIKDIQTHNSCTGINAIFLVGGFSESKILQQKIKEEFNKCQIVVPLKPQMAIVKGSIIFAYNPMVITERIAAYTYGIREARTFQQDDDSDHKYTTNDGDVMCLDIFKEVLHKNIAVTKENCFQKFIFYPIENNQQVINIQLYNTKSENVKYTTENHMKHLATLKVALPGFGKNRKIEVTLNFSGTEIVASAKNLETQETTSISVDFLIMKG